MDKLKVLIKIIEELIKNKFYGRLELKFESGNIIILKKEESIKI